MLVDIKSSERSWYSRRSSSWYVLLFNAYHLKISRKKRLRRIAWFSIWWARVQRTDCRWSEFGDLNHLQKRKTKVFIRWPPFPFRLLLITSTEKLVHYFRVRFTHKGYFAKTVFISSYPNLKIVNWRLPSAAKLACENIRFFSFFAVYRKTDSNSLY